MWLTADVIQPINIHVQHGMFDFHIVLHILRIKGIQFASREELAGKLYLYTSITGRAGL